MIKWIKSLIEKVFKKTKTTSELLREGFDEEQKALELEEIVEEPVVEKIQCKLVSYLLLAFLQVKLDLDLDFANNEM